jgi:hypothetical protein
MESPPPTTTETEGPKKKRERKAFFLGSLSCSRFIDLPRVEQQQ